MKTYRIAPLFLMLLLFGPVTLVAADQEYQYGATCADCHGMPPVDAAYRNVTTGGFKGSHATHNPPSIAPASSCEKCHFDSGGYQTSHMNDFVNMTSNINASPHPGKGLYNKARFFNVTSNPVMQTCSNVNCHFETVTPAWSSTQFVSPANCNGCHGAPPADGSHPAASGSGKKHGDYYTTSTSSCDKCHPDHTAEAAPFAHATSVGHRGLIVAFTTGLNGGFGRYTGNVSYPNYLPSQSPSRNGTCRTTYCHSPGDKSSAFSQPNMSAAWGGTLTCRGCHKADIASGSYITTGSHGGHVNKFGMQYNVIKCYKCHASTASAGMTVVERSRHVNGQVDIAFSNTSSAAAGSYKGTLATPAAPMTKAPGSAYGQCTNVYCHSTGQGDGGSWPPTYRTPTWGTGSSGDCGTCHGNQFSHVFGSTSPISSGSHTNHLSYTLSVNYRDYERCVACHAYTRDGFNPNSCNSAMCHAPAFTKHSNYEINVSMPIYFGSDAAYSGSSTPGDGYGSCSNVYCHSDAKASPTYVTATWGGATLGCAGCHGSATANGAGGTSLSGKHQAHVNNNPVLGTSFGCIDCHVRTVSDNTTISSKTFHVNKLIDYTGIRSGGRGGYAGGVCSGTYCHSSGKKGIIPGGNEPAAPSWTTGTLDCKGCHGKTSSKAGEPDYASVGTGLSTSNSHLKHVGSAGDCVKCHAKTTANGTSILATTAHHLDRNIDVNFQKPAFETISGSYNSTTRTCSTSYCHSGDAATGANPQWGGTLTCGQTCHKSDATVGNLGAGKAAQNGHSIHYATGTATAYTTAAANSSTAAAYRFECSACHGSVTSNHGSGGISANQSAGVYFEYTSPGRKPAYTGAGTTYTDNPYLSMNYRYSVGTNGACNSTYCHSDGTRGTAARNNGRLATLNWTMASSGAGGSCNDCHGNGKYTADYRRGFPLYTSGVFNVNGVAKGNAHQLHVDNSSGAAAATDPQCLHCHAGTTTTNTSITNKANHVDKGIDVSAGGTFANGDTISQAAVAVSYTYTYNAAGSSCSSTTCHPTGLSGSKATDVVTWNDKNSCDKCHKVDMKNSTGYHHAMRNYSGSGAAYPKTIPGATAGGNDINRRCTMCHVDHATFSPNLNASNATYGSAGNLRMSIYSSVTATKGYINRDFIKIGSGGICISCHNSELFKDTGNVRVKNESNSTKTVAIVLNSYTGSAHEYAVSSTMKRDSKVFYSDCSKCHNGRKDESAAFSAMTTATHGSPTRRLYASLGTTLTDGNDAQFCFRCHSTTTDSIGGSKKTVTNKDYYNTISMTSAAEGIFATMDGAGAMSYPTSASDTLYLRNNSTTNAVPPATDPAAYKYSSGTYTTSTYNQRDMAPASGSAGTTTILSTGATAGRYNRGIQFVSPQINNTVTIPSGSTFTLTLREVRAAGTSTDYTRFTVYKWSGNTPTPLNTNSAPGNFAENATAIGTTATNRSTTFTTNTDVTLSPGDALVCDVEFYHSSGTTALNVTYSYGNFATDGGKLALPAGTYNWRTGSPTITRYGHNVASTSYDGLHKPSTTDETQAYLSSNRHVSCNDCHNPHAASATDPIRGTSGINPTNSTAGAAPTSYTLVTVSDPDQQYKVCFKCHTDWAGYGTGTQNLAVAFNTNNDSFHWVETDRGAAKASTSYGTFNHTTVPTKSYTYVDAMMPRHASLTDAQLRSAKMRCSDCHGSNASDGGVAVPEGPHGSTLANILKVPAGSAYTVWNSTVKYGDTNVWCFNCHSPSFTTTGFSTGGTNLHSTKHNSFACQYCHLAIPHGPTEVSSANQRKRLLKPTVFTESIDSLNSGSMGQSPGHSATIPGCT